MPSRPARLWLEDFQDLKSSLSGDFCSRVEPSQVAATLVGSRLLAVEVKQMSGCRRWVHLVPVQSCLDREPPRVLHRLLQGHLRSWKHRGPSALCVLLPLNPRAGPSTHVSCVLRPVVRVLAMTKLYGSTPERTFHCHSTWQWHEHHSFWHGIWRWHWCVLTR